MTTDSPENVGELIADLQRQLDAVRGGLPAEIMVTPLPAKVRTGLQTITGYAGTAAIVVTAVLGLADVVAFPTWVEPALLALATVLGAITNRNRSDQAVANANAAGQAAAAALLPVNARDLATGAPVPAHVDVVPYPRNYTGHLD